jgi:integrase
MANKDISNQKSPKPRKSKSSNGAGGIRRRSDGRYEARLVVGYQDNGKPKRISIYGTTERDVRRKLNQTIHELDSGIYCDKDNITFTSWMLKWLDVYAKPSIKPSTYTSYKTYINGRIAPYFGNIRLQDLQPDRLQQFLNYKSSDGRLDGKQGGNSAKTVLNIKNMIHAALKQACINGLVSRNVADLVKAPTQRKKEMRVLSTLEEESLIKAAYADRYGFPIILALYTGMRIGEILALKAEELSLDDEPLLRVRASIKREYKDGITTDMGERFGDKEDNKTVVLRSSPKTYTSIRDIPLIPEAVEILKKQLEYIKEDKERAGMAYTDYGLVFANPLGQPFDQRTYADTFERIVKSAGVEKVVQVGTNDVSVGFHTLRHTFATRAVENGMDILVLSKILGHAQPSTTLNKYGHVLADHMRTSMECIRPTK